MKLAPRLLGTVLLALFSNAPAVAADPFTIVLDNLQSPRGLTFGPGGRLYVAQAGNGGNSGKITEISSPWLANPAAKDLVTGLISVGDSENGFVGVAGLSAIGNGAVYAIMEIVYPVTTPGAREGHLLKVSQGGQVRDVANVANFDYAWFNDQHPDLGFPSDHPDANPYGMLALSNNLYVTDAATNTLDVVHPNGSIEILAYFPNNAIADSTPTCIAQGPDGALYIGTLALVDSLVFGPSATVYRVDPRAADPGNFNTVLSLATPWTTGLWPVNGCAFGPDGSFYASELVTSQDFSGGDVVKIPFATPSVHTSLTGNALTFPAGVAVGPDANVYVSNGTAFVPQGQVVRLTNN